MREIVRELGDAYHPYALDTGQPQSPERLEQRLQACWAQLAELVEQAALPERARERIAKARRLATQLLATLAFFFATIQAKVEALGLAPEVETAVHQQLIPAINLDRVAARTTGAERRQALRQLAASCPRRCAKPIHRCRHSTRLRVRRSSPSPPNARICSSAAAPASRGATHRQTS
jgi:hypothetical protein